MATKPGLGSIEKVQAQQDRLAKKFGPETTLYNKAQARIKRIEDSLTRQPMYHYPGQKYQYVFGFTKKGKKVFLGPFMNLQDADGELAKLDDGEIFEYDTRDLSKATRQMKAELLARGEDADEALNRVGHKLPER